MKKKNFNFMFLTMLLFPFIVNAQSLVISLDLVSQINSWRATLILISRSVIGLAAIGGGIYTYFKVQSDDGGSGKKAIGNFVLALVFAALLEGIIEFFLN